MYLRNLAFFVLLLANDQWSTERWRKLKLNSWIYSLFLWLSLYTAHDNTVTRWNWRHRLSQSRRFTVQLVQSKSRNKFCLLVGVQFACFMIKTNIALAGTYKLNYGFPWTIAQNLLIKTMVFASVNQQTLLYQHCLSDKQGNSSGYSVAKDVSSLYSSWIFFLERQNKVRRSR